MANIKYISIGSLQSVNGVPTSDSASVRYRIILPSEYLSRWHHLIQIAHTPPIGEAWEPQVINDMGVDFLVFSKSLHAGNEILAQAQRRRGQRVVLDIDDNYFDHVHLGKVWQQHFINMCHLATDIVVSAPFLADVVKQYTGRDAIVIGDPVEGPHGNPFFAPDMSSLKLLWYGYPSNWAALVSALNDLLTLTHVMPMSLTVVTTPLPEIVNFINQFNRQYGERLSISLQHWSTANTWQCIQACDLVIIPRLANEFYSPMSPNRLLESIWGGRFVVAHPTMAYTPYEHFCWLGDNVAQGVAHAMENKITIEQKILAGQDAIARLHSPELIARQWNAIFESDTKQIR